MNKKLCIFTMRIFLQRLFYNLFPQVFTHVYDRYLPEELLYMAQEGNLAAHFDKHGDFFCFESEPDEYGNAHTIGYLMNGPRDPYNRDKILRNMKEEQNETLNNEFAWLDSEQLKLVQEGLKNDTDGLFRESLKRAKELLFGDALPEDAPISENDVKVVQEEKSEPEAIETTPDTPCPDATTVHLPNGSVIETHDEKSAELLSAYLKEMAYKSDYLKEMAYKEMCKKFDEELKTGESAIDHLGYNLEKSKKLFQIIEEQMGKQEPVSPVDPEHEDGPITFPLETPEEKRRKENIKGAREDLCKIHEMQDDGEWKSLLNFLASNSAKGSSRRKNPYQEEYENFVKKETERLDQNKPEANKEEAAPHMHAGVNLEESRGVTDQEWKEKKFKEYTDTMFNIFQAKNQDYTADDTIGSSFDLTFDLFGPIAPAVRFIDKVLRYVSLASGKEQQVSDEKIEDTLTDLANYALLTRLKIEKDKKCQK